MFARNSGYSQNICLPEVADIQISLEVADIFKYLFVKSSGYFQNICLPEIADIFKISVCQK